MLAQGLSVALRRFVERHRQWLGWVLGAMVFAVIAIDYFLGAGFSVRLLELRLMYAATTLLLVGYIFILSTPKLEPLKQKS